MTLPKVRSLSYLSLTGVVLLVGGLGIALFAAQQQQDNRSKAAGPESRPTVPSYITTEKSSQTSLGPCYQPPGGGDRAGAMCKSDGGTQSGYVSEQQALDKCPGGFVHSNARSGGNVPSSVWYCPGGNDYRCCKNAKPAITSASADKTTINAGETVNLTGTANDPDAGRENWRSYITYKWSKVSGPTDPTFPAEDTSPNAPITGLQAGTYVFRLTATDLYASDTRDVTVTVNGASGGTKLKLDLLLHGIANAGDNVASPGKGNFDPEDKTRKVKVEIRDIDDASLILAEEGEVTYDSASGSYKGEVEIDSGLTNEETYKIWVKLSHSLWNKDTTRKITLGQTYTIPQLTLENGDANDDGFTKLEDYNLIRDCYYDPDIGTPAKNCNPTKKEQADIDDDGEVHHFDLSLLLREMSVQD